MIMLYLQWKVGDRCLAVWSKNFRLYDAKIVKVDQSRNVYKVRYEGYDDVEEWPSDSLCPVTAQRSSRDDRYNRERPRHQRREGSWQVTTWFVCSWHLSFLYHHWGRWAAHFNIQSYI